jgi:hypothetical protein
MKYIIVLDDCGGEQPIIFPEMLTHSDVAIKYKVVSASFMSLEIYAGFKTLEIYDVSVWGKSSSLNVSSRTEDEEIIRKFLYPDKYI